MNKSFVLLDKNNNLQKNATAVVKFNLDGRDYLVYSVEENEQNSQIFVSRLVLNSEGKYFIDNILPEEKGKLNNVVYNIVILVPTDVQKGTNFDVLVNNLLEKFSVKLVSGLPVMDSQEYYSNCSVAITSKVLVEAAVKLYDEKLNVKEEESVVIPTWTAPVEVTAPTPAVVENNVGVQDVMNPGAVSAVNVQEPVVVPNLNLQSGPVLETVSTIQEPTTNSSMTNSVPTPVVPSVAENVAQQNQQVEKIAVVSDPSLGINVGQANIEKNKEAGFANTKYIVIGSICLALAVAVVVVAYVLISNMK